MKRLTTTRTTRELKQAAGEALLIFGLGYLIRGAIGRDTAREFMREQLGRVKARLDRSGATQVIEQVRDKLQETHGA